MRDPVLVIISVLSLYPNKPLKFYIDASGISRATFFKAKAGLEDAGIVLKNDEKQIIVDREKCLRYVADEYPGVTMLFAPAQDGSAKPPTQPQARQGG